MKKALKKLTTSFELLCAVSVAALGADMWWLLHDIITNGFTFWYLSVGIGLGIGVLGTIFLWYRHFIDRDPDSQPKIVQKVINGKRKIEDDSYRHKDD